MLICSSPPPHHHSFIPHLYRSHQILSLFSRFWNYLYNQPLWIVFMAWGKYWWAERCVSGNGKGSQMALWFLEECSGAFHWQVLKLNQLNQGCTKKTKNDCNHHFIWVTGQARLWRLLKILLSHSFHKIYNLCCGSSLFVKLFCIPLISMATVEPKIFL